MLLLFLFSHQHNTIRVSLRVAMLHVLDIRAKSQKRLPLTSHTRMLHYFPVLSPTPVLIRVSLALLSRFCAGNSDAQMMTNRADYHPPRNDHNVSLQSTYRARSEGPRSVAGGTMHFLVVGGSRLISFHLRRILVPVKKFSRRPLGIRAVAICPCTMGSCLSNQND